MQESVSFLNELHLVGAVWNKPKFFNIKQRNGEQKTRCRFTLVTKTFKKENVNGEIKTVEKEEFHNIFLTENVAKIAFEGGIRKGRFVELFGHLHYNKYYDITKKSEQTETQVYCNNQTKFLFR